MRTNPFLDALLFLLGYDDNYKPLGVWQYPLIVLFDVLVALNIVLLIANWRTDPAQRTGRNIYLWIARSLLGAMWLPGHALETAAARLWRVQILDGSDRT